MSRPSAPENFKIPRHVAIIMDGNGRWASQRGLPRTVGHRQGVEAVRRLTKLAAERDIKYLTLFGFSSENWARPAEEISELMRLLRMYLRAETAELHASNVRLRVIGDRAAFEREIQELIQNAEKLTFENTALNVTIALNYGGRKDILQAAARFASYCSENGITPGVDVAEEHFSSFLSMAGIPDPDLLIRTSGEQRMSNFLLWQCAYSEMFFTPVLWPDFSAAHLDETIAEFNRRDRRFGGIKGAAMEG